MSARKCLGRIGDPLACRQPPLAVYFQDRNIKPKIYSGDATHSAECMFFDVAKTAFGVLRASEQPEIAHKILIYGLHLPRASRFPFRLPVISFRPGKSCARKGSPKSPGLDACAAQIYVATPVHPFYPRCPVFERCGAGSSSFFIWPGERE